MNNLITIFHLTSRENADAIIRNGDCPGVGDSQASESIVFTDRPLWRGCILDLDKIPEGSAVLSLSIDADLASDLEVHAMNPAQRYREWRIPPAVLTGSALTVVEERTCRVELSGMSLEPAGVAAAGA